MIAYVYVNVFELKNCLFYENNNLKNAIYFAYLIRVSKTLKAIVK